MVLRDGRKYIGVLRSYDQFGPSLAPPVVLSSFPSSPSFLAANLVLSGSFERLYHPPTCTFADIPRGVFLIRGENVVLIGEIVSVVLVGGVWMCSHAE